MDRQRILELALEGLQKQKAQIDQEIEELRADLNGREAIAQATISLPAAGRGRASRAAQRKAQSERMRLYWATKRAKAAKVAAAPKTSPGVAPKRRAKTAAEKKALSLKMKAAWKRRKAAAKKGVK